MIADTTFIIDLLHNEDKAVTKLDELDSNSEQLFITSISIFELFSGVAQSSQPDVEKLKVKLALEDQAILSLSDDSAEISGEIHGILIKTGKMIGVQDCMIAGIAIAKKDKILTRNVKDFSKIKGLGIESY